MRSWTIAFSLGIIVCGFIPQVPALPWLCLLLIPGLLLHCSARLRPAAAFLLGCCWLLFYARHSLQELWPGELENVDVWVQGTLWSLPQQTERALRFEFRVEKLCPDAEPASCDFANLPTQDKKVLINLYQPLPLTPGQRWQLQLRLRRPHGFANPGGFDYEAWLMQKQIRATGYVRQHPGNVLLDEDGGTRTFTRLRAGLVRKLAAREGDTLRYGHLIRALTIGDHYGISEAEWTLFSQTGTNHLIVISGLHVALIALVLYRVGWWLATRWTRLLLWLPAPQFAALLALCGAWVYAGLAGLSLPVQRAFVMAAVLFAGKLLRRQTAPVDALCLALALILLLDPLAPQNAGFWLSYCAVAVLLLAGTATGTGALAEPPAVIGSAAVLRRLLQAGWRELRTQWLVFIGLLPVMLLFFQQISLAAPLLNLPAIPYIGLLVVPLSLLATALLWIWPPAADLLLQLCDLLLAAYMHALQWSVAQLPFALVTLPALTLPVLCLLCTAILLVLFATNTRLRLAALLLTPLVFLWPREQLAAGRLRLTVLDVGQGLAVVASTRNHHLLYDAGPYFSTRFDAGNDVVLPYLRRMNIRRLDMVLISHADNDHAGGLPGIAAAFPQALYSGSDTAIFPPGMDATPCRAGQAWQWDGVDFAILHPDANSYSRNNGSCVLRISTGASAILLPGDIERSAETQLLQQPRFLRAELLLAPHHGSRTSSSPDFVAAVAPELVVYASGYRNRFNHPLPEVRARYVAAGSRELLTAVSGALSFEIGPGELTLIGAQRRLRRRFWASAPE
jgi:competence protein ComEC